MPLEITDKCGTTVLLRLDDGRLRAQRVDCRTKACAHCGPRLRAERAGLWAQVMAGEVIYRWEGPEADWVKLQRRKVMQGEEYGPIPAPDDRRVVYTTAPVGDRVPEEHLAGLLAGDFEVMPNDSRRCRPSEGWRRRVDCIEAFASQPSSRDGAKVVEFVGILRQGLEHARQLAREFGVYEEEAGVDGSAFIFRQPDDPQAWRRFKRWAGLDEPGERRSGRRRRKLAAA